MGLYATILELVGLLIRIRVKNDFWARSFSFKAFTARSIALLFGSLRIPLFSDNGIPTRFKKEEEKQYLVQKDMNEFLQQ